MNSTTQSEGLTLVLGGRLWDGQTLTADGG